MKTLEEAVGARLLDRLPRSLVATEAGKILYRHGRSIISEKEAAIKELSKLLNRVEGPLTVCASTIPGEYLLPPLIARFHTKYPGVSVELQISDSKDVCDKVLSGKAEVGFVGAGFDLVGLEFRPFASDKLALVAPDTEEWEGVKSVTLEQLAATPFLSRERGSGTRYTFEQALGGELKGFNVVGQFGSTNAIKEALRAGLGVAILSLFAVGQEVSRGEFKTIEIDGVGALNREFFMVLNKTLTTSPITDAFIEHLADGKAGVRLTA